MPLWFPNEKWEQQKKEEYWKGNIGVGTKKHWVIDQAPYFWSLIAEGKRSGEKKTLAYGTILN